jgi:inosose dehydratase
MRVGIAATLWGQAPFLTVAEEARDAGYAGIEGGTSDLAGDLPLARRTTSDVGLPLIGGRFAANWFAPEYRDLELDQLRAAAEFLADLGGSYIVAASHAVPERWRVAGHGDPGEELQPEQWGILAESIARATDICTREFELQLVFRNQLGSYVETSAELDRLLSLTDPTSLMLAVDVGYLFYIGTDPMPFIRDRIERVAYVTLKDVDADLLDRHLARGGTLPAFANQGGFPELGGGHVDLEGIVGVLREGSYDGWLVVDQDTTLRDPAASAQISRECLVNLGLEPESV